MKLGGAEDRKGEGEGYKREKKEKKKKHDTDNTTNKIKVVGNDTDRCLTVSGQEKKLEIKRTKIKEKGKKRKGKKIKSNKKREIKIKRNKNRSNSVEGRLESDSEKREWRCKGIPARRRAISLLPVFLVGLLILDSVRYPIYNSWVS